MARIGRRDFLRLGALALGAGLTLSGRVGHARAAGEPPWTPIGFSQGGLPLVIHHLGEGTRRAFVLGGHHGGPEKNSTDLARLLLEHFVAYPAELPPGIGLDVMPLGNPDGTVAETRRYLSGVDPNRNWGGSDWSADAYDSSGTFEPGLGGSAPFSEQETHALADWVLLVRPALLVNFHSRGGFIFGSRDGAAGQLSAAFAEASGYYWPPPGSGSPLSYRATGSMNVWTRELGIPSIFVELSDYWDPELDRNLAGLRAALGVLATQP